MNLDELRTFLEVVDSGSLVTAARRLNVTPSTVTARINGLEDEIGQKLLHRHKSGAELARKHKLPAYVIFHDATLAEMAHAAPDSLEAIENISGVGVKKLEAYGRDILRVLGS